MSAGRGAPAWARELGPGLDPRLVVALVTCAASPWLTPERLRRVIARRLEGGAATDVEAVIGDLAVPPKGWTPLAAEQVERAARALLAHHARVVTPGAPGYPLSLAQTWPELGAPAWLFVRPVPPRRWPAVAIVGTRRPSLDGLRTARSLGAFLAAHGVCVVSGMARGIDQAAHQGALDGRGHTIAVLGTGFGVDYPHGAGALREQVAESGGLVSEYLPGVPPRPANFLWRNRLISGLSTVVVVVEGRSRSGALQTARLAAAQGREVFAVPGSLNAPASRAPLELIRDGARVLTAFEDVLETLETAGDPAPPAPPGPPADHRGRQPADHATPAGTPGAGSGTARTAGLGPLARNVLGLLSTTPATAGLVATAAALPMAEVLSALGELERRGLVTCTPRGFITLAQPPARGR